jgi:hypothetical protein
LAHPFLVGAATAAHGQAPELNFWRTTMKAQFCEARMEAPVHVPFSLSGGVAPIQGPPPAPTFGLGGGPAALAVPFGLMVEGGEDDDDDDY